MPPSRRSSKQPNSGKIGVTKPDEHQSQWMMLVEDSVLEDDGNEENRPVLCKLRHPKAGAGSLFLFSNGGRLVSEAIKYKEDFRSWFIGNTIQRDGGLLMLMPVDPVFLVLPYLITAEKKDGKFMTLDQIVVDEDFPECNRLLSCTGLDELHHICDIKGDDDFKVYRFDKDKTLSWLKLKAENVADTLEQKGLHVGGSGTHTAMFVRSNKEHAVDKHSYLKYACGIVSDYLPLAVAQDLREYLGLKDIPEPVTSPVKEPPAKKAKLENLDPTEDYSKTNGIKKGNLKDVKLTVSQKKLSKVDKTGMKSISSFFSPKQKT